MPTSRTPWSAPLPRPTSAASPTLLPPAALPRYVSFGGRKRLTLFRSVSVCDAPTTSYRSPVFSHVIPMLPACPQVYRAGADFRLSGPCLHLPLSLPASHPHSPPPLLTPPPKNSPAPAAVVAGPTLPATTMRQARVGILSLNAGVARGEDVLPRSTTRRPPRA